MGQGKSTHADAPGGQEAPRPNRYTIEAVDRAIDVLMAFSHSEPSLTLGGVVSKTGLPKSTVFRMLSTLCARSLCHHDPVQGLYSLGYELLKMADIRRSQININRMAIAEMETLRDVSNETIVLSVRDGDFRINIDYVESLAPVRRVPEPGRRAPLYVGAASKMFLACMSDVEIDDYLERTRLEPIQPGTITNPDKLREVVATIRRLGYSESRGEQTPQGYAIAAPIRDHAGEAVAVISVSYVKNRFTPDIRKKSIAMLLEVTDRLSLHLGAPERS